jgi:acyl transferase domain-containing protein
MLRKTLIAALATLAAGCGMGTPADEAPEQVGASQKEELYSDQWQRDRTQLDMSALTVVQRCSDEVVRPRLSATVREMVQLRTREVVTDVGSAVQSSYLNTNGENEEIRRGIAEFEVQGAVERAVLRFRESRTVWPYPVPADTHRVSVYLADFKATIDDFADPALDVARFETDVNSLPMEQVTSDVTRAVQTRGPFIGFRFELENLPGSGTQFDEVELLVRRCRNAVREL